MSERLESALAELAAAIREEVAEAAQADGPVALLSIDEASRRLGLGRTATYSLVSSGQLRSRKVLRRRLIPADAVDAFVRDGHDG